MAQEQGTAQEFSAMGQKTIETMMGMQRGFLGAMQELNHQWVSGFNAETALASEFFAKLAEAKSIPDAAIACQGCVNRQMEIFAENSRQMMAASEKYMPQLFGNGSGAAST
ncbi:MAG TPA: phasin family protein [Xanthobacteraceae bacterium]|jgi:tRNA U55 pseudouridine synthase TruB|nr:phasin family protein [Xanthobacteraceae bacterium]